MNKLHSRSMDRRNFLKTASMVGAAIATAGVPLGMSAQVKTAKWAKQIGLELYTVRDVMVNHFEATLDKVAQMGYKEVEPANGYNNMSPADFRKLLDKNGLTAPSTHNSPTIGPDLEKQFEGLQIMGIKYTSVPANPRPPAPPAPGTKPRSLGAYLNGHNAFTQAEAFGPVQNPMKLADVEQRAADLNKYGKMASKFGVKMLIHNHTGEFEKLVDSDKSAYDIYLTECDPAFVTMQLDIGWATIAGQDVLGMFKKYPGRFELWHIKDIFGIKLLNKSVRYTERTQDVAFEPYGVGQIDYKPFFDQAELAGLKHFCVEQDNGPAWGDSVAAARISYENLTTMLTTGSLPDALYH
jgi:sugar phosphate isomerase/epimerase